MQKGYYTTFGYMGLVNGSYMLFATDEDYFEWIEGKENTISD